MLRKTFLFDDVDIQEVIWKYTEKFPPQESVDCSTPEHIALVLVYEKYYFRISSDVACTVIFNQKAVNSLESTILVAGGGQGLRNRHFWGTENAMMKRMTKFLKAFLKPKAS